jgi:arylsulfatase A-like enzyme
VCFVCFVVTIASSGAAASRPNIVHLMADELGYFEPGYAGNPHIRTPHLDRMAAEGLRFTRALAGSAVCAPTRACFLTGKHSGHTSVRLNGGGTPLRAGEATIASLLKPLGYATGGFGKWGAAAAVRPACPRSTASTCSSATTTRSTRTRYYPPYLIRNSAEVPLPATRRRAARPTRTTRSSPRRVKFIRANRDRPFFAYLPFTPPHGIFDIPDSDPAWALYKDQPWPRRRAATPRWSRCSTASSAKFSRCSRNSASTTTRS